MPRIGARFGIAAALAVLALILLIIALAYFAHAVSALLASTGFSAAAAAAITGAIAVVLAVILGFFGRLALRAKPAARAPAVSRANGVGSDIAADLGALAAQQIVNTTRAHPYSTMGAALAAGLAVGAVPELRRSVMGLFNRH
ncbi:MAG TPA: hypothetical protein VM782_20460 [Stellaceae bacterium]|nr:hypothetical protein [Stellaceae bacterium]